jgi:hypothetical protein
MSGLPEAFVPPLSSHRSFDIFADKPPGKHCSDYTAECYRNRHVVKGLKSAEAQRGAQGGGGIVCGLCSRLDQTTPSPSILQDGCISKICLRI